MNKAQLQVPIGQAEAIIESAHIESAIPQEVLRMLAPRQVAATIAQRLLGNISIYVMWACGQSAVIYREQTTKEICVDKVLAAYVQSDKAGRVFVEATATLANPSPAAYRQGEVI